MSVAAHLGIDLREYDRRIRTFIPHYEEMLDTAAASLAAVVRRPRVIVDLGTGTGALAARCLREAPSARIIGIDRDEEMLSVAARRLGRRLQSIPEDFARAALPSCDAMTASFSLHHIASASAKQRFYRRAHGAIRRGGAIVIADCFLPSGKAVIDDAFRRWRAHLERSYAAAEAKAYLKAWGREDTYFPLADELRMLERAGFTADAVWRRETFAVLVGYRA